MTREELEKKAKELGITFDDDTSDEDLSKAVKDAEEKNKDKNNTDNDPEFWKQEAKKAFEERDNAKKERRSLQNKIKDLEDRLNDSPKPDEFKSLKKELDEMKKFKKELDTLAEEESLKQKSEAEKAEIRFKKEMEEFKKSMEESMNSYKDEAENVKKLLEDKEKSIVSLRNSRLKSEIIEYAAKYKAYNPSQIVKLIQENFEYDNNLDRFVSYKKDDKGKLVDEFSVEDVVKGFLEDPENDNLVNADFKAKGLHTDDSTKHKKDDNKRKEGSKKYDPNDEDIKAKADFNGLSIEDYIDTLEIRDQKMAKIQERKEKESNRL